MRRCTRQSLDDSAVVLDSGVVIVAVPITVSIAIAITVANGGSVARRVIRRACEGGHSQQPRGEECTTKIKSMHPATLNPTSGGGNQREAGPTGSELRLDSRLGAGYQAP